MLKIIVIYILSILGIRRACRQHVKRKLWLKEDGEFEILWIIPIINTTAFLVIFINLLIGNIKILKASVKNKFLRKILNLDL